MGEFEGGLCFRWGDLDLGREESSLSLILAEASCLSDLLVEAIITSRSATWMVSGPVWGEKTHNLDGQRVREMETSGADEDLHGDGCRI